ncbi:tripartite ATP-independent transporter solute receptor, DctP family [Arenibacter palladensis]|uniref:Tripartite ATP-independent transporter solute receptor, DctP family n=1 Tax=Arenibacter palladensis TaxID=237373 RepID=A0A1M4TD16_9FLAO|nr:TRAP transporter substrate-binding protein [Arenibacter palladensis]SHE42402.1 tripartite ATP-independent transporter solute receptor, DctP family [Arenibacter palladensis]
MKNKVRTAPYPLVCAILVFIIFLFVNCGPEKKEPEFLMRTALLVNEDHTWYKAFAYFSEILEERSKGRIKVELYPSEQLAKEIEAIRLIQAEVIDMTTTGSTLTNWFEVATFCELPFLMQDSTDMNRYINGPVGKLMEEEMIKKAGLRALGHFERGPRHLTSNRPIRHPDDLKGLIIRVPNVPAFVTTWSALGAKPTPMAFSEVFTSLQQGTIEAQENPFAMIHNAGFSEVQKYLNLTGHVISWVYPVVGEKQFQKLPPDLQEIFLQAGKEMQHYEHRLYLENEKNVQDELKAEGMQFIEVDKEAFAKKSEKAIYESLSPDMKQIYRQLKKEKDDAK